MITGYNILAGKLYLLHEIPTTSPPQLHACPEVTTYTILHSRSSSSSPSQLALQRRGGGEAEELQKQNTYTHVDTIT